MATTIINTPHDRFFRNSMSELQAAKEFLHVYLPENMRKLVDLNTLQPRKDSFVDQNLRPHLTDMLFSVNFAEQRGYLYLLHEHKSKAEKLTPFTLWRYILAIMEQDMNETKRKILPIVYPIIYYNGRASYPYSTDFFDLFGKNTALAKQILLKPFQLVDLTKIPDEELLQTQCRIGFMGLMMKHCRNRNFPNKFRKIFPLIRLTIKSGGNDYVRTTFYYLLEAGNIQDKEAFITLINQELSPELGELTMTLAEQFRTEGRTEGVVEGRIIGITEGKAEGLQEAKRNIALSLLQTNVSIDIIKQATGLSLEEIQNLK